MLDLRLQTTGNFRIEIEQRVPNAINAVFGPSGAGKSTLLRAILGFEPALGQISFAGETWLNSSSKVNLPTNKRRIGYVRQSPQLFPHLTVQQNLAVPRSRVVGDKTTIRQDDVISFFRIEDLLTRKPSQLSGGELQRAVIARTLMSQPRLLLLDEPLTGLDLTAKSEILPILETLHTHYRIPTLYVSHAIDEITSVCQHTIVLSRGRVIASGPTNNILERRELEDMLGAGEASSLIDAKVVSHDAKFHITLVQVENSTWSVPLHSTLARGTVLRLRIRARDVALAKQLPKDISVRNTLSGTITSIAVDEHGPTADCIVACGNTRLRARITRAALADIGFSEGDQVYALVKAVTLEH